MAANSAIHTRRDMTSSSSETTRCRRIRGQFEVAREVHLHPVALPNRDCGQPIQESIHGLSGCLCSGVGAGPSDDDGPVSLCRREACRPYCLGKTADQPDGGCGAERRPVVVVYLVLQTSVANLVGAGVLVQAVGAPIWQQ